MELRVSNKPNKGPFFMVLWGKAGVGKSGMCLSAPNPFYLSLEGGTEWLPAEKFVDANDKALIPKTMDEFWEMMKWLLKAENRGDAKTIVIDSLGFFEKLNYDDVLAKAPQEKGYKSIVDMGYEGMGLAMKNWERLLAGVQAFKDRGINVIMITHGHYINVTSPDGKSYKEIGFALQSYGRHSVQELITRACDYCYYMAMEIETATTGKGTWSKTVALGNRSSETVVTTRQTPLFFAKTRAIDETKIPDCYVYSLDNRNAVQQQIFKDILNG